ASNDRALELLDYNVGHDVDAPVGRKRQAMEGNRVKSLLNRGNRARRKIYRMRTVVEEFCRRHILTRKSDRRSIAIGTGWSVLEIATCRDRRIHEQSTYRFDGRVV